MEQNNETLSHHGIPGMRWGVRRYQNKDGSLTPAGRKRVAKMKDEYTKLTGKRLIRKPTSKDSKTSEQNKEDVTKKRIKDLSDTELRDKINRLQMEKQAKGLESDLASNGEKFVSAVGKQVIAPAAIDAGKRLLTNWLMKVGEEKLGLNPKEATDALKELKRETEFAELRNRKDKAEREYTNRMNREKEKQASDNSKNKDSSNKETKKESSEKEEPVYGTNKKDWDFNTSSDKKTDPWSKFNNNRTYDAVYEDLARGEDVVRRYNQLQLPMTSLPKPKD